MNYYRNIHSLFSIPVYSTKLITLKKEIKFIKELKFNNLEQDKNGLISNDKYVLNNNYLKTLKDLLIKEIDYYKNNVLEVKKDISLYIKNSWVMMHNPKHFAQPHYHMNSFISGIFYIEVPENSGNLVLHNHANNSSIFPLINVPFEKCNKYNSSTFEMNLENNQLVLFPSSLFHSVKSNLSKRKRISLAFNVLIQGNLDFSDIGEFKL